MQGDLTVSRTYINAVRHSDIVKLKVVLLMQGFTGVHCGSPLAKKYRKLNDRVKRAVAAVLLHICHMIKTVY